MSGLVILMTLVGGLGTLMGPMVGAMVIVGLENKLDEIGSFLASATGISWFNTLGDSVTIVTGLIFIVCVLAFRRGIVGEIDALFNRYVPSARRRAATATPGDPPILDNIP
jgi:branched-chain amino acid transport system permease protein